MSRSRLSQILALASLLPLLPLLCRREVCLYEILLAKFSFLLTGRKRAATTIQDPTNKKAGGAGFGGAGAGVVGGGAGVAGSVRGKGNGSGIK